VIRGLLNSYSQVVFARSATVGVIVLTATCLRPQQAALGAAGATITLALGRRAGLHPETVASGALGVNGLLVFLAVGAFTSPATWPILLPVVAVATVAVYAALGGWLRYHANLPAVSLPFVLVAWLFAGPATPTPAAQGPLLDSLTSMGALVFTTDPLAGALVLIAILWWSRLAAAYAGLGLAAAATLVSFGAADPQTAGFNSAIAAIALGSVFYIPSASSVISASLAAVVAAYLTVALPSLTGLPALALPLNLVVLVSIYALAQRTTVSGLRPVQVPCDTPEATLHFDNTRGKRFPRSLPIPMRLPFRGSWTCTQGNDGDHTHQGPWRHGLDFEIKDTEGRRFHHQGQRTEDWLCYRRPVLAMATGTVVGLVDGIRDNKPGLENPDQPYGNHVVIQHGPALFSVLAHLSPGSFRVVIGESVQPGQVLGLCGSSGRSPMPHLHVHLQQTARVGDPTCAIAFHDVISDDHVHLECLPTEGGAWRNPDPSGALHSALSWPTGEKRRLKLECDGVASVEHCIAQIDALGQRSLFCEDRKARLWFACNQGGWTNYDYVGPQKGALFAMYCAMSRIPSDGASSLGWTDWLNPRRVGGGPLSWLIPSPTRQLQYARQRQRYGWLVTGTAEPGLWQPVIETRLMISNRGVLAIDVAVGDHLTKVSSEPSQALQGAA
jgi:murein DD-endopeptidase MepM/ murein hydrolase activator NlpD